MSKHDYEALRDEGLAAMTRGDLRSACHRLEAARDVVAEAADELPDLLDQAEVNLAMIRVQVHEDGLAERGLREVLLRSGSDDVIRLAAHCLAKILSRRSEHEKAMKYARLSLERAERLGDPLKLHAAYTLLGALNVNHSYLEEALAHYEKGLALLEENPVPDPVKHSYYWCMASDNVGYVLVLLGRVAEGRLRLELAHEKARALGITELVAETATDLCFAHLQEGRHEEARRFGLEALEIAEGQELTFFRRNCYYLLGEIASRSGDDAAADKWFATLGEFYPQVSFLGDFLKRFDVSQMINLKEFA